ncbi:MAG: ribonuclease HI family protein [Candidatus Omnitrophica bacterium]|nr:ribonuclease HI family protein [Candidatus Omnitrophota bacterium]
MKRFDVYVDGGARGNPGPAGIGTILYDEKKKKVGDFHKYIGVATNNVAEYYAVIYGLQEALFLKADEVRLFVDSELVYKQLKGEYRVKDANLKPLFELVLHLIKGLKKVEVKNIPREDNKEADKLVNKAINLKALL